MSTSTALLFSSVGNVDLKQHAVLEFDQIRINADKHFKCNSNLIKCGTKFECNSNKKVLLNNHSCIKAERIIILGNKMVNYGRLRATENIYISLNGCFINDFYHVCKRLNLNKKQLKIEEVALNAEKKEKKAISNKRRESRREKKANRKHKPKIDLSQVRKKMSKFIKDYSFKGKTITVISAIFVNLGGRFEADIYSNMSLILIDFLGINLAYRNLKNSLISLNLSLNIPNLFEIVKAIIKFDTKRLQEIFFGTFDPLTAIGLLVNAIKFIFPQAGMILGNFYFVIF